MLGQGIADLEKEVEGLEQKKITLGKIHLTTTEKLAHENSKLAETVRIFVRTPANIEL